LVLLPLIMVLFTLSIQDLKKRAISTVALPALLFLSYTYGIGIGIDAYSLTYRALLNSTIIGVQIGITWIYVILVKRDSIHKYIGLGDIVFLLCITPLFGTIPFVVFCLVVFTVAWAIQTLIMCLKHDVNPQLPLVSYLGLGLISVLLTCSIFQEILWIFQTDIF
jgi:hypothetical protein